MRRLMLGILAAIAVTTLSACPEKGPAQKAGEKVDRAKDKVSDTLDPKGPGEKAGRAIDRATDK
jgi:predicted small lipoprotein YifL